MTHDVQGNRLTATGFGLTRTDVFDALNRVAATTFNYGPFSKQVQYTCDQASNRKNLRYPDGRWVNSTYDALNRLMFLVDSEISPSEDFGWTFTHDKASRVVRSVYPSGLCTDWAHNNAEGIVGVYTNTSRGSVVESWTYTDDDVGIRLTMTENTGNVATYAYDSVCRLTNGSHFLVGPTGNCTHDGVGNGAE